MTPHYVKVREAGARRWAFLSAKGTTSLRVRAVRFGTKERAQALIDENASDNPEWEWKVVEA